MSLQDLTIKTEYRSLVDEMSKDFYIPLLSQAISYKRAVGFFSSSALIAISTGISELIKNGGQIQLIATPYLSDEDVIAIKKGYEKRNEIVKQALESHFYPPTSEFQAKQLNLLANLISYGYLDIKIALTNTDGFTGMYHEKLGLISDSSGNSVAFSGSMNESATAFNSNYEAIDVFCSWDDSKGRVASKEKAFELIWNGEDENVCIFNAIDLKDEFIKQYQISELNPKQIYDEVKTILQEELDFTDIVPKAKKGPCIPDKIKLHDYQLEAIDKWEEFNYRGIFDMATGTGKTFTGLGAAVRLSNHLDAKLAVFIVCPYQHLVEQWVEDIKLFNIKPIVGYSASLQKDWKKRLEKAILQQKLNVPDSEFFCFVTTNATFNSKFVQAQIQKIRVSALLIADEAHNFGAEYLSQTLTEKFDYRLGLSATISRHNDAAGTQKLFSYFGEKCIEYTLERAIREKKLTPYMYYPILCSLSGAELEEYHQITKELAKCFITLPGGIKKMTEYGKKLALKRSRLVAGAEDKVFKLREIMQKYKDEKHILVYCGATKLLGESEEFSEVDEDDLRQIDVVTNLLGNELNMKVSQFTSKEDMPEREILKREFSSGDDLQALIAIKCLDEGVNIPKIKTAFILASTTNPKEYIQRRGRVLRLAEGKSYAEIYDFVTLPRPLSHVNSLTQFVLNQEKTLVKNELVRLIEFSEIAMNSGISQSNIEEIIELYSLEEKDLVLEEEFDYE